MAETVVDDLAAWLTAVWDEEERAARWVLDNDYSNYSASWSEPSSGLVDTGDDLIVTGDSALSRFIAAHDPASVLARIAADRDILADAVDARELLRQIEAGEVHADIEGRERAEWEAEILWRPVEHLASAYADRRPEWLVERQGVEQ